MAKNKEITGTLKLQILAGQANPAPPVGTALGPKGVDIAGFCKEFNERTKTMERGIPVPVFMTIYKDRSFTFETGKPPTSYLLKKAAGLKKGSQAPGRDSAGKISREKIREIAEIKMEEMGVLDIEAAMRTVEGSAVSMGIKVE